MTMRTIYAGITIVITTTLLLTACDGSTEAIQQQQQTSEIVLACASVADGAPTTWIVRINTATNTAALVGQSEQPNSYTELKTDERFYSVELLSTTDRNNPRMGTKLLITIDRYTLEGRKSLTFLDPDLDAKFNTGSVDLKCTPTRRQV